MTYLRTAVALGLGASVMLLPPSVAHAAATCQGRAATIEASAGTVEGTSLADVIIASGTVTRVDGGDGDDVICLVRTRKSLSVDPGPGGDVVDASRAGAKVNADLGPGADRYLGSEHADEVTVGLEGDTGADEVSTGAGKDLLELEPGAVVDARLGPGADKLSFDTTYAGPDSVFDLGAGRDVIYVEDRYDDVADPGETSLVVDMVEGRFTWRDVTSVLRGADDTYAVARRIDIRGNDKPNAFFSFGCDVTFRGGGGDDSTLMKTIGILDTQPFECHDGEVRRAYGNRGDDTLRGGRSHDVLVGGPGRDRAHGGPGGDDVCIAEIVAGKGCLA